MFFKILLLAFILQLTASKYIQAENYLDDRAFEPINWLGYRKRSDVIAHGSLMNMLHPLRKNPNQKWIDLGYSWGGK